MEVATGFRQSELDLPASVFRITAEEWRLQGARRTLDALEGAPGVYVAPFFQGIDVPTFRGHVSNEPFLGTAMTLDGFPLNHYATGSAHHETASIELATLEEIEVLRGPGSALHGSDAFAGLVALTAWDPGDDAYEVGFETGSFDQHRGWARLSRGLGDAIRWSTAVSVRGQGDEEREYRYHDSFTGERTTGELAREAFSLSAHSKLHLHDVELAVYWNDWDFEGDHFSAENQAAGLFNGAQTDGEGRSLLAGAVWDAEVADHLRLEARGHYREGEFLGRQGSLPGPVDPPHFQLETEDRRAGVSLTARRPVGGGIPVQALLGYSFDWMEVPRLGFFFTELGFSEAGGSGRERTLHSVRGQVDWSLLEDRLRLFAGGRWDVYSDVGDQVSPRAGVVVHPVEGGALKLLYGTAFRAPSALEQGDLTGFLRGGGDDLDPETIETIELAWQHVSSSWRYGVTLFHSEVEDGVFVVVDPEGSDFPFAQANALSARSRGVEVEGSYTVGPWTLALGGSHVDAETRPPGQGTDIVRGFPRTIVHASLAWIEPDLGLEVAIHDHHLIEIASALSISSTSFTNEPLPDYWRTDLHLGWHLPEDPGAGGLVYLDVRNLLDRDEILPVPYALETGVPETRISVVGGVELRL